MFRPKSRRLKRIGFIMIVVSVALFAVSVYLLSAGTSEYTVTTHPSGTSNFYRTSVHAGDDLTYKISYFQSVNLTATLISPNGTAYSELNYTQLPTGPDKIIAPDAGNWTFELLNNGQYTVNVTISYDSTTHSNVNIKPFNTADYHDPSVKAQSEMSYSISLNQVPDVYATLISPGGSVHSSLNLSSTQSGSNTIIAPSSGIWNLQISNNGSLPVNVSVTIGDTSYAALGITIFGFVLLPSGIALIAIYTNSVRMEKKRRRMRQLE